MAPPPGQRVSSRPRRQHARGGGQHEPQCRGARRDVVGLQDRSDLRWCDDEGSTTTRPAAAATTSPGDFAPPPAEDDGGAEGDDEEPASRDGERRPRQSRFRRTLRPRCRRASRPPGARPTSSRRAVRVRRGTGTASTAAADGSSMTNAAAVAKPASANHSIAEPGPFGTTQPSTIRRGEPERRPAGDRRPRDGSELGTGHRTDVGRAGQGGDEPEDDCGDRDAHEPWRSGSWSGHWTRAAGP